MTQNTKDIGDLVKTLMRPILITGMGVAAFYFIVAGIDTEATQWWIKIFFAGVVEWIIERPVIKVATKSK